MVKCTSHGFLTYVFVGIFLLSIIVDIDVFFYEPEYLLSNRGEFAAWLSFGLAAIVGLIFVLMLLRNFAVYVENDTIVHVNWRKKKRVFHPKDLETINIGTGRQSGRQEYFFLMENVQLIAIAETTIQYLGRSSNCSKIIRTIKSATNRTLLF